MLYHGNNWRRWLGEPALGVHHCKLILYDWINLGWPILASLIIIAILYISAICLPWFEGSQNGFQMMPHLSRKRTNDGKPGFWTTPLEIQVVEDKTWFLTKNLCFGTKSQRMVCIYIYISTSNIWYLISAVSLAGVDLFTGILELARLPHLCLDQGMANSWRVSGAQIPRANPWDWDDWNLAWKRKG